MNAQILVVGAYGRDYTSLAKAKADWNDDRDFSMVNSNQKINKSDADRFAGSGTEVWLRYNKLNTKALLYKVQ